MEINAIVNIEERPTICLSEMGVQEEGRARRNGLIQS